MAEDDYCYVTTTGRRTGRTHEIEIWYERSDLPGRADTIYLLAGGGESSDWVRNLIADPHATVRFGSDPATRPANARILKSDERHTRAEPGDEDNRARDLVFAKYQPRYGGDLTSWRERALPVALDLDRPAS